MKLWFPVGKVIGTLWTASDCRQSVDPAFAQLLNCVRKEKHTYRAMHSALFYRNKFEQSVLWEYQQIHARMGWYS